VSRRAQASMPVHLISTFETHAVDSHPSLPACFRCSYAKKSKAKSKDLHVVTITEMTPVSSGAELQAETFVDTAALPQSHYVGTAASAFLYIRTRNRTRSTNKLYEHVGLYAIVASAF
jgi:hypothetical protein